MGRFLGYPDHILGRWVIFLDLRILRFSVTPRILGKTLTNVSARTDGTDFIGGASLVKYSTYFSRGIAIHHICRNAPDPIANVTLIV